MNFKGNGLVWDNVKNKSLCKFVDKEYKTDDKYTIDKLIGLGYESDYVEPKKPATRKPRVKKIEAVKEDEHINL